MTAMVLSMDAVHVDGERIDVRGPHAAMELRRVLGPVVATRPIEGVKRSVSLLARGAIILSEERDDAFLSLVVCFDPDDGSPYPTFFPQVPTFAGAVECAGHHFVAREPEGSISRLPGVHGFAGVLSLDQGDLHVGLHLKRPRNRFGKRAGTRQLVFVVAEWGEVKPFPSETTRDQRG